MILTIWLRSLQFTESLVKRMLPPENYSITKLSNETGISKSTLSRPRVSNDNPYSEALFRTCKYRPNYPYEGFTSINEARKWVMESVDWYNNRHYHSGLNFITPNARHDGTAQQIMEKRKTIYRRARALHPERWTKETRSWDLEEIVALNPTDKAEDKLEPTG